MIKGKYIQPICEVFILKKHNRASGQKPPTSAVYILPVYSVLVLGSFFSMKDNTVVMMIMMIKKKEDDDVDVDEKEDNAW